VFVVRRSRLFVVALALAVAGGVTLLGGLAFAGPNPPGNNGTIKVDDQPFDDLPNNEPHVGCTFQVDFYGYDQGDLNADVTFEAQPPTLRPGGGSQVLLHDTVFIGEDDNSGGGSEAGLDASETYTLDFAGITPHPVQGFHVKLTIHADGSQGADTKYKVFWVQGCGGGQTTTTTGKETTTTSGKTTTTSGKETTTTGKGTTTSAPGSSVGGSSSSAPGSSAAGGVSSSTQGGGGLAFTGGNTLALLVAGLAILGLGAATLLGAARRGGA
jgi:hypothetical protein